jgi:hypothetical protein
MDIDVPSRAKYLRTIWSELSRVHSHLLWLGLLADAFGFESLYMECWRLREDALDMFEASTGGRVIFSVMKVGGVRRDVSDEMLAKAGISRADYNAMKQQTQAATGGYYGGGKNTNVTNNTSSSPSNTISDSSFLSNFTSTANGGYKGTAPSSGNKVPTSSNDSSKTGTVKTNTVVYIPEQDKYKTVDDKTNKRSSVDTKQTTWKRTTTK